MKEDIQLEQYKQAHVDRLRSVQQQWQMIGVGNPLVGGVLIAAIANPSASTSLVLSAFAIPVSFFLLTAYCKEAYFENLASENIEAIEAEFGVKHLQYDTFPQKPDTSHYITRRPKRWSIELLSVHTSMMVLVLIYNVVAAVTFVHFASPIFSLYGSVGIAVGIYPALYGLSFLLNKGGRIARSFRADAMRKDDIEPLAPVDGGQTGTSHPSAIEG